MKKQKWWLGLVSVSLLLCLCAGCAAQQAEQSQRDTNTLVIALTSEPEEGFDPCVGWGRYGSPLIQSTLVVLDNALNVQNDLATSYTISDDGLKWTFYLRDDVKFSNGETLSAQDVAFTYETAKNSGSVVDLSVLEEIVVVSDTQIEFLLTQPQITFIYTVAQTGIVCAAEYDENYYKEPIGSGPFTLLQWDQGQQVILGVNPYYYGDVPNFEQITILFMTEETAYIAATTGEVDVAITNSTYATNEIAGMHLQSFDSVDNRGITLPVLANTGEVNAQGYAIGNDVTADLAIRQALSYGIDRAQLIEDCLNGYGSPAYSECDGLPWGSEDAYVAYDIEQAIAGLEQAGWVLNEATGIRQKDGLDASFTLLYNADDLDRQALSLAVAAQAKLLGIEIIVEGTSWDDIEQRMYSNAVLMGWGAQNPLETYFLYHSSNVGQDYYNPENFSSDAVDQYIELAMCSTDYQESLAYFKLVQWDGETGVSTQGESPWVWLVNTEHLYFVADGLSLGEQKIHPHGHAWPVVANLAEWEWVA